MNDKKAEPGLRNQLKSLRTRLGLSQQELAQAAGISRQTIGGVEAALFSPSAAVALRIARALGCRVEEVFWLEDEDAAVIEARPALDTANSSSPGEERLLLGRVGEAWIAHTLSGDRAFRSEMVPADGILLDEIPSSGGPHRSVKLLDSVEALSRTVLIAGCAPALSLWARSAERWHPGLRAAWIHLNSTQALEALVRGDVHIAGLHLHDFETGEDNLPFVHRAFAKVDEQDNIVLINFGAWEEGLIVAAKNPKGIREVMDLRRLDVKIVNRDSGAGARMLLDSLLGQNGISLAEVGGYGQYVDSHQEVARTVLNGGADAGMGTAAVAQAYGLGFVPLHQVRYDLALRRESLDFDPIKQLLGTLEHRWVRSQLQVLGGYDTTQTGQTIIPPETR